MLAKRRSLINSDEKRKALQNVVLARGRLKGALKTVSKSSDDSTGDDDSDEESQMKRKRLEPPTVYQPYIINLFNRGIDVARFRENSPLYPMCRAWVKNNPRQKIEETISASATKPRVAIKREHNPDIVSQLANGELHEIKEMPRPATTSMEPFLVVKPQPADDFDIDKSSQSKDEILSEHLVNWKKLRESNITHRKQYEQARFGTSFKLLEALKK